MNWNFKMMKNLVSLLFVFALASCSTLEVQDAGPRGEVTEFGIFAYSKDGGSSWINPASTAPTIHEGVDSFLVKETTKIPLIKDIHFAFSYQIYGLPNGEVFLDWVVKHPEIRKPDGTVSTGYSYKRPVSVENGIAIGTSGYILNQSYELVPGEWSFTYSYKGIVLASKVFETVVQ